METLKIFDGGLTQQKEIKATQKIANIKTNTLANVEKNLEAVFKKESTSVELGIALNLSPDKIIKLKEESTETLTIDNVLNKLEHFSIAA